MRSKIRKLFIWWYRFYMSWKPRCWNRKFTTNKTPQRYRSFVRILQSLWTKSAEPNWHGATSLQHFWTWCTENTTVWNRTAWNRNSGITGGQSTRRSTKKRSAVEQCCFLTAMMILTKKLTKSLLMKSMLIPLQISTLRTERRTSGFLEVASHSLPETGGHRYSKCLFDFGVAEQERTSVQCSWTRDDWPENNLRSRAFGRTIASQII